MKPVTLAGLALLATTSPAFAGQVIVVGPLPTQVANIQAAIEASVDGDVILVKSGTYTTFSVPNKSIAIVADAGQVVNVVGAARVRNLTVDRKVLISGLNVIGQLTSNIVEGNGFYATSCAGAIRVQNCTFTGFDGTNSPCATVPRSGAEISNCADVSFVRCTLTGSGHMYLSSPNPGLPPASRDGNGLVATSSSVSVHETTARGGYGGLLCNGYFDGTDGGDGVRLQSTFVFGANSAFAGADGQSFLTGGQLGAYGGYGGDAVVVLDATSSVHVIQSTLLGGSGGYNFNCGLCGSCCSGDAGQAYTTTGPALDVLSSTAPTLSAANIGRESTALALTIHGVAGDRAALAISRDTQFVFDPLLQGVTLVGEPVPVATRFMILGTIPANGTLRTTLQLPAIPLTDPGRTLWLQLLTTSPSGASRVGSPLTVAVVDSSF
jgi:hypothetical protein